MSGIARVKEALRRFWKGVADWLGIRFKSAEEVAALYKEYYKDATFTHYCDKALDLKQVVNTNKALVHTEVFGRKVVVTSMIDNLLKGAVGQAVQNMNIMFGLDERAGLNLKASAF